jgi:hypothetical protein
MTRNKYSWRAVPRSPEAVEGFKSKDSRQQRRARRRAQSWARMSGENALRDEGGIIRRSTRRSMSLSLAKL